MRAGKNKQAPGVIRKSNAEHGSPAPQDGNVQKPRPLRMRSLQLRGVKRCALGHAARQWRGAGTQNLHFLPSAAEAGRTAPSSPQGERKGEQ